MRIFLHIGAEKTGTSSIQRFFKVNRDLLRSRSVLYSKEAGFENHMALAAAAQSDEKIDDLRMLFALDSPTKVREYQRSLRDKLVAEARESGCSKLVFSGEHCSSRLVGVSEVETLAEILRAVSRDIAVVVYIRRQDDFFCSTYSTDVKSGFTGGMTLPSPRLRQARYDYYELLRRWSSVFGRENIICRIYDTERLKNGDVVDDFAEIIGLALDEDCARPPRANESLDVAVLEFLRLLNKTVPRFVDNRLNPQRGNMIQMLEKISNGPSPSLPELQLRDFMEYFRKSNAEVANEYFGGVSPSGDPLFGEAGGKKNRQELKPIDAETAVMLAGRLWQEKQQQVLKQAERIAKLERELGKQPHKVKS